MITEITRNRKHVCDIRYDAFMNEHDPFAFARWLQKQMDDRGMKGVDLTRLTGKGSGTISGWLSAGVVPSPRSLRVIADALGLPWQDVYAAAGRNLDGRYPSEIAREETAGPTYESDADDPDLVIDDEARIYASMIEGLHHLDLDPEDRAAIKRMIDYARAESQRRKPKGS